MATFDQNWVRARETESLPIEVLAGALLGALIGSLAAILGAVDSGAVRLAVVGASIFGSLGLANWISRVPTRLAPSVAEPSHDRPNHQQVPRATAAR